MDPLRWQRLRSIYESAEHLAPEARDAVLREACGDDEELLREVRRMLRSEEGESRTSRDSSFLEPLTGGLAREVPRPDSGTRIGAFQLGPALAAGGMGTVYEAYQDEPRRKVALKLLHQGLASPSAVRRFRFEAELLAQLRHPGIAPIYEAGVHTSSDGSEVPFLAMELVVDARDVLRFSREEQLELDERIELFLQVLAAAQHGHQQGVVHRDLKPHNILVDREGRVRVIDFGIARAVGRGSGLGDFDQPETQLTGQGEILGTLGYMSPEQFAGDSSAIDTRSDVYSLGVVLHELLCDRPPFEFGGRSLLEISRTVCEEPIHPPVEVPVDLGWVLAKALAKDPEERYATASEFATDLKHFLDDEPVVAGAPSATYRLRKFVRRYRVPVAFGGLALAGLVVGAIAALVGLWQAKRAQADLADQRDVAIAEALKFESLFDMMRGILLVVAPDQDGRDVRVADLLDRAAAELTELENPYVAGVMHQVLGSSYENLSLRPEALAQYERSLELLDPLEDFEPRSLAHVRADLAGALIDGGRPGDALVILDLALREATGALELHEPVVYSLRAIRASALLREGRNAEVLAQLPDLVTAAETSLGRDAPETRALRVEWGHALRADGDLVAARDIRAENVVRSTRALGPLDPRTLGDRLELAQTLEDLGNAAEAAAEFEDILPAFEQIFGRSSARTCMLLADLAEALMGLGRLDEAYALLEEALPCLEATVDPSSTSLIHARGNFAVLLQRQGDGISALKLRRAAWQAAERYFGPEDPRTITQAHWTAVLLQETGSPEEALEIAERVARLRRERLGGNDPDTLEALEILAKCLNGLQQFDRALEVTREVFDARTELHGPEHSLTLRVHNEITAILAYLGRFEDALREGERMLAIHRRALPESDPARTILLGNLGLYARRYGQIELASEYHLEAYRLASAHVADDDVGLAIASLDLGEVLAMRGKHDDAKAYLTEATDVLRRAPGSRPDLRGRAHGNLGVVLWHLGDLETARDELMLAVGFYERSGDEEARTAYEGLLRNLEQALDD